MEDPQGRGHRGHADQTSSPDAKATTYLVSIKTASNHIAPSKHIHTHVHVSQALPGLCHHPLQVVLPPVIVGKEAIAGVKEDPERWQGPAEARPSWMGHLTAVVRPSSMGHLAAVVRPSLMGHLAAMVSLPDAHGHTSPRDWGCPVGEWSHPGCPHGMPMAWPAHTPARPPYTHRFCSFSSSCHLSCPLCTTLSYHSTRPPGTC